MRFLETDHEIVICLYIQTLSYYKIRLSKTCCTRIVILQFIMRGLINTFASIERRSGGPWQEAKIPVRIQWHRWSGRGNTNQSGFLDRLDVPQTGGRRAVLRLAAVGPRRLGRRNFCRCIKSVYPITACWHIASVVAVIVYLHTT